MKKVYILIWKMGIPRLHKTDENKFDEKAQKGGNGLSTSAC